MRQWRCRPGPATDQRPSRSGLRLNSSGCTWLGAAALMSDVTKAQTRVGTLALPALWSVFAAQPLTGRVGRGSIPHLGAGGALKRDCRRARGLDSPGP